MGYLIARRILAGIPTLLGVTLVVFLILRLVPGDPVAGLLSGGPATPELVAGLRAQFGLDQPLPVQYLSFLGDALQGDLGTSYATGQSVTSMISGQLLPTVQLAFAAALLSTVAGIGLGVLAAAVRNSFTDGLIRVFSVLGTAMPTFWIGLMLILVVSFQFRMLPATGSDGFQRLILPAVALAVPAIGVMTRLVRANVLEVLGENFVTALHAKGLSYRTILLRHVLRNAVLPAVTVAGLQIGGLLAGAVVVETVFARQGLGNLILQAITRNDYPVLQGVVIVIGALVVLVNIVVDLVYGAVDPRIRSSLAGR
ncbi:ABC transporter permease [Kineosporia babensis]|uniref:ABC transporter permease n=1 Tax=Kineosporia babensis TaxID=499548 RepID=A0A9X1SW94_9ACTN|nr:ABC transporter permease [Kineosporia babensis]MCD5314817.1 ABC transporter permease [Kineosporia babensis]